MRRAIFATAIALGITLQAHSSAAQQKTSSGGPLLAAVGGAVVGGAIGYYWAPVGVLTSSAVGVLVGATVGHWWYQAAENNNIEAAPPRKQSAGDPADKPFRLIGYTEAARPTLRAH